MSYKLPDIDVPLSQWTDEDWQAWAMLMLTDTGVPHEETETVAHA